VRSCSPRFSSRRPVSRRDAGNNLLLIWFFCSVLTWSVFRIVEFASQEDAQRAIRELSEQPLLGRPVFIREVRNNFMLLTQFAYGPFRIEKMSLVSGPRLSREK
jgi:hypothetical protein